MKKQMRGIFACKNDSEKITYGDHRDIVRRRRRRSRKERMTGINLWCAWKLTSQKQKR